ncbi:MAG: IS21 family transposase, partial [Pyrinomonadaceae bacterium]
MSGYSVLGASGYLFAQATAGQTLPEWMGSHIRMLEFYGGCPAVFVPDNLRSGVTRPCRYEPEVNRSYADL